MPKRKNSAQDHEYGANYKVKDFVAPEEDEEIDEDEAFNSEDERKYGSFFDGKGDVDDSSSDGGRESESEDDSKEGSESDESEKLASDDDDSQQGDGGQYMLDLLDQLDSNKPNKDDKRHEYKLAAGIKESEFAVSNSNNNSAPLTLDALVNGIKDTPGFGSVQRDLQKIQKATVTPVAAPKVVTERAKRKVHTKHQEREISAWQSAVNEIRHAETLDFTTAAASRNLQQTGSKLVAKFVPMTDLEKEIHEALTNESNIMQREEDKLQDDLGRNEITLEEYKKRRGELAKMRALMFYQEQKRHHINKIKSKKYRKIRKKHKSRLADQELEADLEDNPDLARELEEKEEVERMKERATLAHKNTSKWAKRVLRRGNSVDIHTRRALSAQLKKGDELLQRMKTAQKGYDDDDSDSDNDGNDLVESARKVLQEIDQDDDQDDKAKGVFKMAFMQKGLQKQKDQAKDEARQLLMELEANQDDYDDEFEPKHDNTRVVTKSATKKEMEKVIKDGSLVASSLQFGNSNAVIVGGSIDVGLAESETVSDDKATTSTIYETSNSSGDKNTEVNNRKANKNRHKNKDKESTRQQDTNEEIEDNPWLVEDSDKQSKAKNDKNKKSPAQSGIVDVEKAVTVLPLGNLDKKAALASGKASSDNSKKKNAKLAKKETEKGVHVMTQEELVEKAFATVSEEDADAEFALEKSRVQQEEEVKIKTKKRKKDDDYVSGWGSWTGKGAIQKTPVQQSLDGPPKKSLKRQSEDAKKPDVIISAKRMKNLADKYMLSTVPYPYKTREEYERAMAGGIGKEWNVSQGFKSLTRPEVLKSAGKIIQPLSKKVKQVRPAAKF